MLVKASNFASKLVFHGLWRILSHSQNRWSTGSSETLQIEQMILCLQEREQISRVTKRGRR